MAKFPEGIGKVLLHLRGFLYGVFEDGPRHLRGFSAWGFYVVYGAFVITSKLYIEGAYGG